MNSTNKLPSETIKPSIPEIPQKRLLQKRRMILLIFIPIFALSVSALLYLYGGRYVETDNAYVQADILPISSQVSGPLIRVSVKQNQQVKTGQLLFSIDPTPFQIALTKAKANLAQTRTELASLQASYKEKQAEIALSRTRLNFAEKEQNRLKSLVKKHYVSSDQLDNAKQSVDLAKQQVIALQQSLNQIAQSLGGHVNEPLEKHPRYLSAKAELDQAKLDLSHTNIWAPEAGIMTKPPLVGQYIKAGTMAMNLVASKSAWITANFTEDDITHMRPGQKVDIEIDTYPGLKWHGVVGSISPATGAEFSLIPAQNATGNWVKISQRVPVRIRFTTTHPGAALRAGLSAWVQVDTLHRRRVLGVSL
jgi:membrane fusion protein (multidrug efflux system)